MLIEYRSDSTEKGREPLPLCLDRAVYGMVLLVGLLAVVSIPDHFLISQFDAVRDGDGFAFRRGVIQIDDRRLEMLLLGENEGVSSNWKFGQSGWFDDRRMEYAECTRYRHPILCGVDIGNGDRCLFARRHGIWFCVGSRCERRCRGDSVSGGIAANTHFVGSGDGVLCSHRGGQFVFEPLQHILSVHQFREFHDFGASRICIRVVFECPLSFAIHVIWKSDALPWLVVRLVSECTIRSFISEFEACHLSPRRAREI